METDYQMIVSIVNAGFSGDVMEAAKSVGAMGGTVIHARGTANQIAEEKFNFPINPQKDLLFIVAKNDIKDKIMKAIYEKTGPNTDANCVCFSLPVTNTIGLK